MSLVRGTARVASCPNGHAQVLRHQANTLVPILHSHGVETIHGLAVERAVTRGILVTSANFLTDEERASWKDFLEGKEPTRCAGQSVPLMPVRGTRVGASIALLVVVSHFYFLFIRP